MAGWQGDAFTILENIVTLATAWRGDGTTVLENTVDGLSPWKGTAMTIMEHTVVSLQPWRGSHLDVYDNVTTALSRKWSGAVLGINENTISQSNPARLKRWDGTQWVRDPYYVWNGTAWVQVT
jgi:hypothetical protein